MPGQILRILLVLTPPLDPNTGGVQMSTWKMASYFTERGHAVSVYSFTHAGHRTLKGCQLQVAAKPGGTTNSANLEGLAKHLYTFSPDVVINQMPYEHEIGQVLRKHKRYLLVGCLRNTLFSVLAHVDGFIDRVFPSPVPVFLKNPMGRWLVCSIHRKQHRADLIRILDTYDRFVMFGRPNLDELRYFVPEYKEDRISLIPNSIPYVADEPPPKEKRLLWLGRVERTQKRAELIPKVWRRLFNRLPEWELDVVGDGPALPELRHTTAEMGLPRINFHGCQVPDKFYSRSAIFFMTSAFEGFPNTLVEAQSYAAVPVVFDSYPVARCMVESGTNGYLVEPFDIETMVTRITELALSPAREDLARRALDSARRFRIDRVGSMWEDLFETEVPNR